VDNELRDYLDGLEQRIVGRVTQRLEGRIDASEERMKSHASEACERIETRLLAEFHKWGRTSDIRTRQALENVSAFGERLLNVEERISALERRGTA
jgi:hypothetical protein